MDEEGFIKEWCESVQFAFTLARSDRLGELRGKRSALMDGRGLHPYSQEVGHILALQAMLPDLRELDFDPMLLRKEAQRDAERQFREEVVEEHERWKQGRSHAANESRAGDEALRDVEER